MEVEVEVLEIAVVDIVVDTAEAVVEEAQMAEEVVGVVR